MRDLVIEPEADDEVGAALDWYERQEPGLGAALLSETDTVPWHTGGTSAGSPPTRP